MSAALERNETTHVQSPEPPHSSRRDPAVLYCFAMMLLPLLAIPAFIGLGRSNFFLTHGASFWVRSNDAVFNMKGRHCDVVVFGDSTAMTGVDPEVVDRETGFHTCNIAVTNAVLAVTGNLTLDRFLAHNEKPKVLVFQLSPDDFQAANRVWNHTIYAEGLLELLRHGAPREARQVLITHPHEAANFAGYAAGFTAYYAIRDAWFHATRMQPEEDRLRLRADTTFFTPPAPARTHCDADAPFSDPTQGAFSRSLAEDFRSRYANRAAVVLVDVAPIPACDNNLQAYAAQLEGITSNGLRALPIAAFNDGRHYTAEGSRMVSAGLALQLNEVADERPDIDVRRTSPQFIEVGASASPRSSSRPALSTEPRIDGVGLLSASGLLILP
ncbi:hypothetical protein SAMN05421819_2759 [Bryocella elongata]|uniref:Uncharacterized protein n=1 Tax=Bryocella elongata TaxID=863522 RepID=A0A1H5ZP81_9BACT|nr:hypothetical protein [Bryocella elongata]SEG37555.1 hypothetical protein SAMN05421819_2759 [Bryocella elongata]